MSYVALIAGAGNMPLRLVEEIHKSGKKVLLLGIKGITPPALEELADISYWAHITQLGKARKLCQKHGAKEAVMAGLIRHNEIFKVSIFLMDWVTLKALITAKDLRANSICLKVIKIFADKGIHFLNTTDLLKKYLVPKGLLSSAEPTKKQMDDVHFGVKIARELGRLDIGQTVVVKNKSIVALEAMEGTDQCIQRAGDIAGAGCVVIKLPKPNQDLRFDVPVVGLNTLEKLVKIKASVLAIAANRTLVIDPEVKEYAKRAHLAVLSIEL